MSDEYVVEITEPLNPIKCANLMHPYLKKRRTCNAGILPSASKVKQSSENYAGYADAH